MGRIIQRKVIKAQGTPKKFAELDISGGKYDDILNIIVVNINFQLVRSVVKVICDDSSNYLAVKVGYLDTWLCSSIIKKSPTTSCGATTLSIMTLSISTLSIKTLSIKGLFATLSTATFSINDSQHNSPLSVLMLNVTFYFLLC
jgi:hypothetical protein